MTSLSFFNSSPVKFNGKLMEEVCRNVIAETVHNIIISQYIHSYAQLYNCQRQCWDFFFFLGEMLLYELNNSKNFEIQEGSHRGIIIVITK